MRGSVRASVSKGVHQGLNVGPHHREVVAIAKWIEHAEFHTGRRGDPPGRFGIELRFDEDGLRAVLPDGVDRGGNCARRRLAIGFADDRGDGEAVPIGQPLPGVVMGDNCTALERRQLRATLLVEARTSDFSFAAASSTDHAGPIASDPLHES